MEDHAEDFGAAFAGHDLPLDRYLLLRRKRAVAQYRGQGIGHAFFDAREAHARDLGRRYSAFCAVVRPEDHPLRPADYRPLDGFWRKRGYAPLEGAMAHYDWRDLGEDAESTHALQIWMRELA
jgi:GNAT superfamily N-acetyltransferase